MNQEEGNSEDEIVAGYNDNLNYAHLPCIATQDKEKLMCRILANFRNHLYSKTSDGDPWNCFQQ